MKRYLFVGFFLLSGCVPGATSGGSLGYALSTLIAPRQSQYYQDPYYNDPYYVEQPRARTRSRESYPTRSREVTFSRSIPSKSRAEIEREVEREIKRNQKTNVKSIDDAEISTVDENSDLPSFGSVSKPKEETQTQEADPKKSKVAPQVKESEDLPEF